MNLISLMLDNLLILRKTNIFRAPTDCTQYFTGAAGNFQSFNYLNGAGQFLQSQNYEICFRQEEGE